MYATTDADAVAKLSQNPPDCPDWGISSREGRFPKLLKTLKVNETEGAVGTASASPKASAFPWGLEAGHRAECAMICDLWVQDWVQVAACSRRLPSRKLRRVN